MSFRLFTCVVIMAVTVPLQLLAAEGAKRPNILWLVSEDNTILLGCYGDKHAKTPTLDGLAAAGVRYEQARAPAPVCAATRTAIITGRYAPSIGTQNMRSKQPLSEDVIFWPELLRAAGYYTTNNAKTDYNTSSDRTKQAWNESSKNAHYKNRPAGAPFYAVFNFEITHESNVHKSDKVTKTDPASVEVQPYLPDTPTVRHDIAQYYDRLATLDGQLKKMIEELTAEGVADDTIIFYNSDHGGVLPRSKRFLYANGTQVPLIAYYGKNFAHLAPQAVGTSCADLVNLIDIPPTVLSLAGIKPPAFFDGRAIAGEFKASTRPFDYSYRDRMDEIYDCSRSVTDGKLLYIRHYMPQVPSGMHLDYLWKQPAMRNWAELFAAGKLNAVQSAFFMKKPVEELFDLKTDWHCTVNLATDANYKADLEKLRVANQEHLARIRDTAFLPEPLMATVRGNLTPGAYASDDSRYPIKELVTLVDRMQIEGHQAAMVTALSSANASMRLWAIIASQELATAPVNLDIAVALNDAQPMICVAACEALLRRGDHADAKATLSKILIETKEWSVRLAALNVIARLKNQAEFITEINAARAVDKNEYVSRLSSDLLGIK
jgi:N-sulfoglucosamine sulfohydrolase